MVSGMWKMPIPAMEREFAPATENKSNKIEIGRPYPIGPGDVLYIANTRVARKLRLGDDNDELKQDAPTDICSAQEDTAAPARIAIQ